MISSMARLTAFEVADPVREWGKIRDFLVEFPSGKARYFSVDAHVGVGVKEIWAPLESVCSVDAAHMAVSVQAEIDQQMVRHLSRLETPEKDQDELRLHRLYHSSPAWAEIRRKKGGSLRKTSRLVRGSSLIGFEAVTRNGNRGKVKDLLFDEEKLQLELLRLQFDDAMGACIDLESCGNCQLYTESHAIYVNVD